MTAQTKEDHLEQGAPVFIEQYRLESNPFAPDRAHPFFASHSVRYGSLKVAQILEGQIQCLYLSGPAGVGKTTLIDRYLRGASGAEVTWLKPGLQTALQLLQTLIKELGPGPVEGSNVAELRNILQVYLKHQAGNGRQSILIADDIESHAADVVDEIEQLSCLRLRNRPVLQFLLLTRNEELIGNLIAQHDGGYLSRAVHYPLAGFTLEETTSYVRTSLKGCGCVWADELVSDEVLMDIQAFTRGVVGDINAMCAMALDQIALRSAGAAQQLRVTRALLKEIGARLHMRYDPTAWKRAPETSVAPDAVALTEPRKLTINAARLLVSNAGESLAEISLNRPRMVLGRDHSCDINLNSSFVSRYQNLFMETEEGWMLIDLNSTNGCFVNGRRVNECRLRDGDLISIGHHQLKFAGSAGAERPDSGSDDRMKPADTVVGAISKALSSEQ
jgi:general secretion pathway protein A